MLFLRFQPRFASLDSRLVLSANQIAGASKVFTLSNKNTTTYVEVFLLGFGPAERASAPFHHLTAEVNSAYDNSPLRSELTPHLRRGPEGPYRKCSRFPRRSKLHIACSDFFQKSERTHSAAPPLQIEPAALGLRLLFIRFSPPPETGEHGAPAAHILVCLLI